MPTQVTLYLAAGMIALAMPTLVWGLTAQRKAGGSAARENLLRGRPTHDLRQALLQRSASERAVRPFIQNLADRSRKFTPDGLVASLERRLALAGKPPAWPLERVLAAKVVLGLMGCGFGLLYFMSGPSPKRALAWAAATGIAYFFPDIRLQGIGQARQKNIEQSLPDVLDQMTICVEAGLGFESAMARAAQSGKGPLAEEFIRTLQEMQVGFGRGEALRGLGQRNNVTDLQRFVTAIVQAEAYGIPVADVLQIQAGELRLKRRQRAEENALKIPVKIVFPLVLCIFPSLFIVILGPAAISIMKNGLGG